MTHTEAAMEEPQRQFTRVRAHGDYLDGVTLWRDDTATLMPDYRWCYYPDYIVTWQFVLNNSDRVELEPNGLGMDPANTSGPRDSI